jgi:hypothetical protein
MHENIFARGPLDEAVPLSPVKPLYCAPLSHKLLLSPLFYEGSATMLLCPRALLARGSAHSAPTRKIARSQLLQQARE